MSAVGDSVIARRLLEEAVRLFAHKGYPATSTREIVEAAGVTKPMLYYYFHSKEGLLAAALDHFVEQFQQRIEGVIEANCDPYHQLIGLTWAQLEFCQQHKPLARLFYALSFGPDDQKNLVDLERYTGPIHDVLAGAIARAADAGLILRERQPAFTMALRGMVHIWIMAALDEQVELTQPLSQQIIDELLQGFHAPTNSAGAGSVG